MEPLLGLVLSVGFFAVALASWLRRRRMRPSPERAAGLARHRLSVVDDHGQWVWGEVPPESPVLSARLDVSDADAALVVDANVVVAAEFDGVADVTDEDLRRACLDVVAAGGFVVGRGGLRCRFAVDVEGDPEAQVRRCFDLTRPVVARLAAMSPDVTAPD